MTVADLAPALIAVGQVAQEAQESVGSGAGRWWLLVFGLGAMTVLSGLGWLFVRRRTLPPAKRPYEPPPLPTRAELDAHAGETTSG